MTLFTIIPRNTVEGFVLPFPTTLSFAALWSLLPEGKDLYQGNSNNPVEPAYGCHLPTSDSLC